MFHILQGLLNANIFYPKIAFLFHSVPWRQCFWPKNQTLKSTLVLPSHISSDIFFSPWLCTFYLHRMTIIFPWKDENNIGA